MIEPTLCEEGSHENLVAAHLRELSKKELKPARKLLDSVGVKHDMEVRTAGHDIAVGARQRVLQRHRVLTLMTHVDPWHRPDLDHARPALAAG